MIRSQCKKNYLAFSHFNFIFNRFVVIDCFSEIESFSTTQERKMFTDRCEFRILLLFRIEENYNYFEAV